MSSKIKFTISEFYCTCCGSKGIPVPRRASKQREQGHLKKLYCIKCKAETNHVEVRPFDYDKEEFMKDLLEGKFKGGMDLCQNTLRQTMMPRLAEVRL